MSRDIPIIYSGPMVSSLLARFKTETRRIGWAKRRGVAKGPLVGRYNPLFQSPWTRVKPGDRLWVRENALYWINNTGPKINKPSNVAAYAADGYELEPGERWTPSIHMPRWASRITLHVTAVRTEPLQEMNEEDAGREGIITIHRSVARHGRSEGYGVPGTKPEEAHTTRVNAFRHLWCSLHGREAWEMNPDVVMISFKMICANIDSEEAKAA